MNLSILAHSFVFISTFLGFLGLVPQIYLNYQLKKGNGISDIMLLGFLNGYIANTFYAYCIPLPTVYLIMCPAWIALFSIVLFQRFYYNFSYQRWFLWVCLANCIGYIMLIPSAMAASVCYGYYFGWLTTLIWGIYQIPQVYKIYQSKSVKGFSFLFVLLTFLQSLLELIGGLILGLPAQTIINDIRGVLIFIVFAIQFMLYGKVR